ncbi:MAG: polysaccharide deacetylase [Myxococcaceae bacterium]|nr:polysaccharide deacetylase [Myxococcaceae bacterium]
MSELLTFRSSRPSLRTSLANLLDAVGAVDAALFARRMVPMPFLPIITYHRVCGSRADHFDDGAVDASPAAFERHLDVLNRSFELIGTEQLRAHLWEGAPLPPNPAMITFDDGYRECHDVALPILRRYGARATFFVATSFVTNRRMFWWDKISYLVKSSRRRTFALSYPYGRAYVLGEHDRTPVIDKLLRIVKDHCGLDVERFVDELASVLEVRWTTAIEESFASSLIMSWDQIRALRDAGMDVESHTRTHRILHTLTPEELESELAGSRDDLEDALDRPVCALAYPVGRSITANARLCAAVAAAGYDLGFSSATGTNLLAEGIHPYDIHRLAVGGSDAYFRATMAFPTFAHPRRSHATEPQ